MTIPVLFLSDHPSAQSGLARIGRDLAIRVHQHCSDLYKVGYLGRSGIGGSLPYPNWIIPFKYYGSRDSSEWGSEVLPAVWREFAGDEKGIVFTIFDPGRMLWLSRPEYLQGDSGIKEFLTKPNRPFKLWGYFPVDGHTPNGTVGRAASEAIQGYDRVLAYTNYGAGVIENSVGKRPEHLPHGLDPVWHPRNKKASRLELGFTEYDFVVGVVATNQQRKDWGTAAMVGQLLKQRYKDRYQQWWHVNVMEAYWSIPALLDEFGLGPNTLISQSASDEWMSMAYSACDVTLAIGAGEGFGFPIMESQLCGVPVLHGSYGGGAEFASHRITFHLYWLEGPSNVMRPVYYPHQWADHADLHKSCARDLQHLYWDNLWPQWEQWWRKGAELWDAGTKDGTTNTSKITVVGESTKRN